MIGWTSVPHQKSRNSKFKTCKTAPAQKFTMVDCMSQQASCCPGFCYKKRAHISFSYNLNKPSELSHPHGQMGRQLQSNITPKNNDFKTSAFLSNYLRNPNLKSRPRTYNTSFLLRFLDSRTLDGRKHCHCLAKGTKFQIFLWAKPKVFE